MLAISLASTFFGITDSGTARGRRSAWDLATVRWVRVGYPATLERFNLSETCAVRKGENLNSPNRIGCSLCPIRVSMPRTFESGRSTNRNIRTLAIDTRIIDVIDYLRTG